MNEAMYGGHTSRGSPEGSSASSTTSSARKVYETLMRQVHERRALASKQVMATNHKTEVMANTEPSRVTFQEGNQVKVLEDGMPGEAFTAFPRLPLELRRRVWYYALPESRVIEIEWTNRYQAWCYTTASIHRTPSLYSVNKEARREFLRFYKPITLNTANIPVNQIPEERITRPKQYEIPFTPIHFFDTRVDVLYLSVGYYRPRLSAHEVNHLNTELLKEIRSIAIVFEHSIESDFYRGPPYNLSLNTWHNISSSLFYTQNIFQHLFQRLPALTELVAVVGDVNPPRLYRGQPYYKQEGYVELTELTRNSRGLEVTNNTKARLQAWMEALVKVNLGAKKPLPLVHVRQASRGGNLIAIDSERAMSE